MDAAVATLQSQSKTTSPTITTKEYCFIVDGDEIPVDSQILRHHSPVFAAMFFGTLAREKVYIEDEFFMAEDLRQALEFIYNGTIRINSIEQAWALCYIGDKYLVEDLGGIAFDFIESKLRLGTLVISYERAELFHYKEPKKRLLQKLCIYFRGLFRSDPDYYQMKPATLKAILTSNDLHCDPDELIKLLLEWTEIEMATQKMDITKNNALQLLQKHDLLQFFHTDNLVLGPKKSYSRFLWSRFCTCRRSYKLAKRWDMTKNDWLTLSFSVCKNLVLFGVVVLTLDGSPHQEYNASITLRISRSGDKNQQIQETNFKRTLFYQSFAYIPLNELIDLVPGELYTMKLAYDDSQNILDLSKSIVCEYMENNIVDSEKNTVATFHEMDGSVVKALCYFPT